MKELVFSKSFLKGKCWRATASHCVVFSCSNVAEKLNTKLANNVNAASAWKTDGLADDTMIMGLASCAQMGYSDKPKMICTGTTHLDSSGLRCSHESIIEGRNHIISEESIVFVVKVSQDNISRVFDWETIPISNETFHRVWSRTTLRRMQRNRP